MLQQFSDQSTSPLCKPFDHSTRAGWVPEDWNTYVVSPIFKFGNQSEPQNYLPVALLSVLSKVVESLITDILRKFPEDGHMHDA